MVSATDGVWEAIGEITAPSNGHTRLIWQGQIAPSASSRRPSSRMRACGSTSFGSVST